MNPGEVSTSVRGSKAPDSSAAVTAKGLTVEPGSNTSVTARLRVAGPIRFAGSFGLYEGWLTIAWISPVRASITTTEPADARWWVTAALRAR